MLFQKQLAARIRSARVLQARTLQDQGTRVRGLPRDCSDNSGNMYNLEADLNVTGSQIQARVKHYTNVWQSAMLDPEAACHYPDA